MFPCVIPLQKNGCGKALLFLPNPELYFPSKMWLKLDFVGLFRSYQKSISNPSGRWFRQYFLTFHYLQIPSQPAWKKKTTVWVKKLGPSRKPPLLPFQSGIKEGKHGMQCWEIQIKFSFHVALPVLLLDFRTVLLHIFAWEILMEYFEAGIRKDGPCVVLKCSLLQSCFNG